MKSRKKFCIFKNLYKILTLILRSENLMKNRKFSHVWINPYVWQLCLIHQSNSTSLRNSHCVALACLSQETYQRFVSSPFTGLKQGWTSFDAFCREGLFNISSNAWYGSHSCVQPHSSSLPLLGLKQLTTCVRVKLNEKIGLVEYGAVKQFDLALMYIFFLKL